MHWKAIIKESSETVLVVTIPYAVNRLNDLSTSGPLRLQRGYTATIVAIQRQVRRCGDVDRSLSIRYPRIHNPIYWGEIVLSAIEADCVGFAATATWLAPSDCCRGVRHRVYGQTRLVCIRSNRPS